MLREVVQSVLAVLAVLLFVYSSNRFVGFITEAALGRTSTNLLVQMFLFKVVSNLAVLAPIGVFLGTIFALGRLHRDSEVVAMAASGVSLRSLSIAMLWFSLACATITAVLSLYVSPKVYRQYEVARERAKEGYHITGILPGRFKSFDHGRKVVYAGGISEDKRSLNDVFVRVLSEDERREHLIVSRRAYQTTFGRAGDRFIVLEDGHRYAGEPGDSDFEVTRFDTHAVRLEDAGPVGYTGRLDVMTSAALWRSSRNAEIAELQWRISLPISVVALGLLAVPLSRSSPRQGRYGKLFVAVLVYFLYNNAVGVARQLVESGQLPAYVGVWPVHAMAFALAVVMTSYQSTGVWRVISFWRQRRLRR